MLLFLTGVWGSVRAAPGSEPSPAALDRLPKLRARAMGVDRAGNLWVWGAGLGAITLLSPDGLDLGFFRATGASAVDVDADWGTVGLFGQGYELQWLRGEGEPRTIRLEGPAADVCWIGPETVAVTPQTAAHRIEIWNLVSQTRLQTLGEETPIHPVPGVNRMRAVLLRYDFAHGLLYSLESFTGDLQVFTRDGRLAWRSEVANPRRAESEAWLQEVDRQARSRHDVQIPTIFSLHLALTAQGEAWVLQRHDAASHTVTLLRVGGDGATSRVLPEGPCPSYHLLAWGSHLISYREPESPQGVCVGEIP